MPLKSCWFHCSVCLFEACPAGEQQLSLSQPMEGAGQLNQPQAASRQTSPRMQMKEMKQYGNVMAVKVVIVGQHTLPAR